MTEEPQQRPAPESAPAQQAAEAPPAEEAPPAAPSRPVAMVKQLFSKRINLYIFIGVIAVLLIGAAVMGSGALNSKSASPPMKMVEMSGGYDLAGPQVPATQTMEFPVQFNSSENGSEVTNVFEVTASCTWTDDYAGSEPDSMTFELVSPDKQNASQTTEGTSGSAKLTLKVTNITDSNMEDNTKGWVLKVKCNFAGHKDFGPFGRLIYIDAGNNFNAEIEYRYYGHPASK